MSEYIGKESHPISPEEAMRLAIQEAKKGAGFVSPNPVVGCVVLDHEGHLVSKGYHKKYGSDHAEVDALRGLPEDSIQDAHLYVTLEPCAHEGKTPSCAKKLASLKVASVTYGLVDPNPLVSGKGIEILKNAGIKVKKIEGLDEELEELAEIFLHNMRNKKPFVALKVASSLDGQMALSSGESKWITNEKSRAYAHHLRGVFDAILVGRRTIQLDNPSLNVRHPSFPNKENKVIVFDPKGEVLGNSKNLSILKTHAKENVFFVVSDQHSKNIKSDLQVIACSFEADRGFDLDFLLSDFYKRGICSILLEGGAFVYQTFLKQNKVQRIYHFQSPILLGAQQGLSWTQGFGVASMDQRINLERIRTSFFDNDILLTGLIRQKT